MSGVGPQHTAPLQDPAGGGLQGGVQARLVAAVVRPGTGPLKELLVQPTAPPAGEEGFLGGGSRRGEPGKELVVPVRLRGRRGEAGYVGHQGGLDAHRGDGVGEGALAGLGVVGPGGGLDGEGTVWSVGGDRGGRLVPQTGMAAGQTTGGLGENLGVWHKERGESGFCGLFDSLWRDRATGRRIPEKGL